MIRYSEFLDVRDEALVADLRFLQKAIRKYRDTIDFDEIITPLQKVVRHLYVTNDGIGCTTNGYSLHTVTPLPLPPGYYRILKSASKYTWLARVADEETAADAKTKKEAWKFPEIKESISVKGKMCEKIMPFRGYHPTYQNYPCELARLLRVMDDANAINLNALQALEYAENRFMGWTAYFYGKNEPVIFKRELGRENNKRIHEAVIMPFVMCAE